MSDSRSLASNVIQPKLRMVYNGSTEVNVLRSDASASVAIAESAAYEAIGDVRASEAETAPLQADARPEWSRALADDVIVSVFLELTDEAPDFALPEGVEARSFFKRGNIAVAEIPLVHIDKLARESGILEVAHVSLGEPLAAPTPLIAAAEPEAPPLGRW